MKKINYFHPKRLYLFLKITEWGMHTKISAENEDKDFPGF